MRKMNPWPLIIGMAWLALSGCGKESTGPDTQSGAPSLPPAHSMRVDLGVFESGSGRAQPEGLAPGAEPQSPETVFNWTNAVIRILFINAFVDAAFTPPFQAFEAAIHTVPVKQPDGSYLWTYVVVGEGGRQVQIHLRGEVEGNHALWELRLSDNQSVPPLDHALWFEGESALQNQSGFWIFYHPLEASTPEVARIDWEVRARDEVELVIRNIRDGDVGEGDVLTYAVEQTAASVIFEDASEGNRIEILWDTVLESGSLKAPDYNGGNRACWDGNHQDVACPDIGALSGRNPE